MERVAERLDWRQPFQPAPSDRGLGEHPAVVANRQRLIIVAEEFGRVRSQLACTVRIPVPIVEWLDIESSDAKRFSDGLKPFSPAISFRNRSIVDGVKIQIERMCRFSSAPIVRQYRDPFASRPAIASGRLSANAGRRKFRSTTSRQITLYRSENLSSSVFLPSECQRFCSNDTAMMNPFEPLNDMKVSS